MEAEDRIEQVIKILCTRLSGVRSFHLFDINTAKPLSTLNYCGTTFCNHNRLSLAGSHVLAYARQLIALDLSPSRGELGEVALEGPFGCVLYIDLGSGIGACVVALDKLGDVRFHTSLSDNPALGCRPHLVDFISVNGIKAADAPVAKIEIPTDVFGQFQRTNSEITDRIRSLFRSPPASVLLIDRATHDVTVLSDSDAITLDKRSHLIWALTSEAESLGDDIHADLLGELREVILFRGTFSGIYAARLSRAHVLAIDADDAVGRTIHIARAHLRQACEALIAKPTERPRILEQMDYVAAVRAHLKPLANERCIMLVNFTEKLPFEAPVVLGRGLSPEGIADISCTPIEYAQDLAKQYESLGVVRQIILEGPRVAVILALLSSDVLLVVAVDDDPLGVKASVERVQRAVAQRYEPGTTYDILDGSLPTRLAPNTPEPIASACARKQNLTLLFIGDVDHTTEPFTLNPTRRAFLLEEDPPGPVETVVACVFHAHSKAVTLFEVELGIRGLERCSIIGGRRTLMSTMLRSRHGVGEHPQLVIAGAAGQQEYVALGSWLTDMTTEVSLGEVTRPASRDAGEYAGIERRPQTLLMGVVGGALGSLLIVTAVFQWRSLLRLPHWLYEHWRLTERLLSPYPLTTSVLAGLLLITVPAIVAYRKVIGRILARLLRHPKPRAR